MKFVKIRGGIARMDKECNTIDANYGKGILAQQERTGVIEIIGSMQEHATRKTDGICTTLTEAMGMGGGQIPMINGLRIRRLTPKECWRLQGFTDEQHDKAVAAGVSDSQRYKQAGNAISVNIAYAIGLALKRAEQENEQNQKGNETNGMGKI